MFGGSLSGSILLTDKLEIGGYVEIRGNAGQGITLDAQGNSQVLEASGGSLHLENISITGGSYSSYGYGGGGIYHSSGTLTMVNGAIFGNTITNGNGGGFTAEARWS